MDEYIESNKGFFAEKVILADFKVKDKYRAKWRILCFVLYKFEGHWIIG